MNVRVIREPSVGGTTFGVVFIDGTFFGYSLEDEVREKPGQPIHSWKVDGQAAIPVGRYKLALTMSPKFGRVTPEVLNVTGFEGIRIHPGNAPADTEGCLLLGKQRNDVDGTILLSKVACDAFQALLAGALNRGEPCWLQVENPLVW